MLISVSKLLLYLVTLISISIFHKPYVQYGAMANTIISISITFYQAVIAGNISGFRMTPYRTFEIHVHKELQYPYNQQQQLCTTNPK